MSQDVTVTDLPARLRERITIESTGCWVWSGWSNDDGYGYTRWEGRDQPVHRVVYVLLVGSIPDGHELDHVVCRRRSCCNPGHVEPVSHAENMERTRPSACRRAGHDWSDPRNVRTRLNGRRYCAECDRQDQRRRHAARTAA